MVAGAIQCYSAQAKITLDRFIAILQGTCPISLVWLFSSVCFQMFPQIACPQECIVTLVAFVWFFSTVRFQMCPQSVCSGACIATLIALVWPCSTMCVQMSSQTVCPRGCIVTPVAFVWLFSCVHFQMSPQMARMNRCTFTLVTFVLFFFIVPLHVSPWSACPRTPLWPFYMVCLPSHQISYTDLALRFNIFVPCQQLKIPVSVFKSQFKLRKNQDKQLFGFTRGGKIGN